MQCIYECRIFATYLQVHNTCSVSTSAGYLQCTGSVLRTIPKFAAIIWATAPGQQLSLCAGAELSNNNAMRMSSDSVFRYCCIQKLVSSPVCCVVCPCCKTQCGCSVECRYCVDGVGGVVENHQASCPLLLYFISAAPFRPFQPNFCHIHTTYVTTTYFNVIGQKSAHM